MNVFNTFAIEKPPFRRNISCHFSYIGKEIPLEYIFSPLLNELKREHEKTERCIIFCQARKQCAILYNLFHAALGKEMYVNGILRNNQSFVQMFHRGSPESVKLHVVKEMTQKESHLRVLICTISFGMGIDCKNVYRSMHFGPSSTVENFVQETGRLGKMENCAFVILYNGLLSSHCDEQIKALLGTEDCRQKFIGKLFTATSNEDGEQKGCLCCDLCSSICCCTKHGKLPAKPFCMSAVEKK